MAVQVSNHVVAQNAGLLRPPARIARATVLVLLMALLSPLVSTVLANDGSWSPPRTVFIEETGHTLDQVFLDVWRDGGREMSYGYPITPEITLPNGHIVQYFQYARFEYWPEGDQTGQRFHFGKIGQELRPISVQRSVVTWTATSESMESNQVEQTLDITRAWLPVSAPLIGGNGRYVEATQHTVQGLFLDFWQRTGEATFLGNPLTEEYTSGETTYQVFEYGQLQLAPGDEARMVPVGELLATNYGLDQRPVVQGNIPTYEEALFVPPPDLGVIAGPGPVPGAAKSIVVSIGLQQMWVYEGDTVVISSLVSTGKPGFDTPTGLFVINTKVPVQDMEGLIGGEYYNVKDVPDVMYFTDVGHAIHGTYWHNNFGAVMSHGCVNLPLDIAAFLYDWAPMGTPVLIVA